MLLLFRRLNRPEQAELSFQPNFHLVHDRIPVHDEPLLVLGFSFRDLVKYHSQKLLRLVHALLNYGLILKFVFEQYWPASHSLDIRFQKLQLHGYLARLVLYGLDPNGLQDLPEEVSIQLAS